MEGLAQAVGIPSGAAEDVIDLRTGCNPIAPPHGAITAAVVAMSAANRYAARLGEPLRTCLADRFGTDPDAIHVNAGSEMILRRLVDLFGARTHLVTPTYGLFYRILERFSETRLSPEEDYRLDLQTASIPPDASLCVITNPNNPSGVQNDLSGLPALAASRPGTLFAVDEAWILPDAPSLLDMARPDNIVVVRTFSKAMALAACRVGYAVGAPRVISALNGLSDAFPTAASSIAAAMAVLEDARWARESAARLRSWTTHLVAGLRARGATVSATSTYIAAVSFPGVDAGCLAEHLARHGVLLSRLSEPWLRDQVLRMPASAPTQNDHLLLALDSFPGPHGSSRPVAGALLQGVAHGP